MKRLLLCATAAAAIAGCTTAEPVAPVVPVAQAPAVVDQTSPLFWPMYTRMAASSDQFEIQSSALAHQMTQNPAVHSFASMLQTDHTQSTQMLMAAAQAARITPPPPALLPQHQALLDQLRSAGSGYTFDQAYRRVQIQAHQQALALHQNYAASGDVPTLRTTAGQIVPVIQRHLAMAQSIQVAAPPPPPPPPPMMAPPPPRRAGERG